MAPQDPPHSFTAHDDLAEWQVPAAQWLDKNKEIMSKQNRSISNLASGNAVFNAQNRILLIQRAAHDSRPGCWELPGGGVDPEDLTILHGSARELIEEAGLTVTNFSHVIAPEGSPGHEVVDIFSNRDVTRWYGRVVFAVDVASSDNITLDPNEHQDYTWASREEVEAEKTVEKSLPITHPAMKSIILRAFDMRN